VRNLWVGGANVAIANVAIFDVGVGVLALYLCGHTTRSCTRTTGYSRLGSSSIYWVKAIQPQHVGCVVIPKTHDEYYTLLESGTHGFQTSHCLERVFVSEKCLLVIAELVGDGIVCLYSSEVGSRVVDDFAVLDVETTDLNKWAVGGVVRSEPLGNNLEGLGGVHCEALSQETVGSHAVGVEVATILIANSSVSVRTITTLSAATAVLATHRARVGCIGSSEFIRLPNIHFIAASSVLAITSVGVVRAWSPVEDVSLAIDELQVMGALRIAIPSSVRSTSLIVGVLGGTTIRIHFHEVEGTVQATGQVAHVHVEGEFLVLQFEDLVCVLGSQEVQAGSDVGGVWAVGDET